MASLKLNCVIVLCIVVVAPMASEATISCSRVHTYLAPCVQYLRSGGRVPPACCKGVGELNNAAKATPDRRAACECIKKAARNVGVNQSYASSLPGKCGVNIHNNVSYATNCKTVK